MDDARALGRSRPGPEGPGARLLVPRRQEGVATEQVECGARESRDDALRDPEVGEQLGALLAFRGHDVGVTFELDAHRERVFAERRGEPVGILELLDADVHDDQRGLVREEEGGTEGGARASGSPAR